MSAGVALAILVWLLAPSVAWFDAGELAASASMLGVSHPTGFPLFHLGTHPLITLPLGPLALRMHLAGALAAVGGCALWWASLRSEQRGVLPWAGALLIPLLMPSVAMHVRAAEVYAWVWLHAGLLVAAMAQLSGPRRTSAVWALGGLGALIHVESAALAACAAMWVTAMAPSEERLRPSLYGAGLATLAAIGLGYLPVAAGRMPALSWGDVREAGALWDHLSAASIRRAFSHRFGMGVGDAATMLGTQLWRELGLLAIAAPLGLALIFRRNRALAATSVALIGLDAAYAVGLNPMGLRDGQVGLIAQIGLALLAWYAVVEVAALAGRRLPLRPTLRGALIGLMLAAAIGLRTDGLVAQSPNANLRAATRLADEAFATAPPGSLMLASSDQRASSCIWQQGGVGVRPDCTCVPLVFTRDPRMSLWLAETGLGAHFVAAGALLRSVSSARERAAALGAWIRPATAAGPVLWERGHHFEDAQVGDHLVPGYPWDELAPGRTRPATPKRLKAALNAAHRACVSAGEGRCTGPAADAVGAWASLWGAWLLRRKKPAAEGFLSAAVQWAPTAAPGLNNLAVQRNGIGEFDEALRLCERALAAQPDYRRAHRTAARAALRAGRTTPALRHARAWVGTPPTPRNRAWLRGLVREADARQHAQLAGALRAMLGSNPGSATP